MTDLQQQKSIRRTVILLLIVMAVILLLFLNKITTPRYLSAIELKVNGFILLDTPLALSTPADQWRLVTIDGTQEQFLAEVIPQLKPGIQNQTQVLGPELVPALEKVMKSYPQRMGLISPDGQLIGLFKPPFDQHKFILTYSSVVTHR